ncbi:MAG: hypothetical protein KAR08_07535 [Candidatus Heimdallarchaeota archaeon]|nr:hypothetical protein [Candidatus Heimdallarchaeota archaeon]
MSSWQTFFNQLTKTSKQDIQASCDIICQCEKGKLVAINGSNFKTSTNCSMNLFCSIIQIDKHRAKTFNNRITIIPRKSGIDEEDPNDKIISLDHLLEKKEI